MASFSDYRKLAANCNRLARHAPSQKAKQSFAAAARHWAMLADLSDEAELPQAGLTVDPMAHSRSRPPVRSLGAVLER
jgi:hypothetical protein